MMFVGVGVIFAVGVIITVYIIVMSVLFALVRVIRDEEEDK